MGKEKIKERPILFSGEMVRAILDGRKTQTRRIVKHKEAQIGYGVSQTVHGDWCFLIAGDMGYGEAVKCPYGQPGDQLWVRETWGIATGPTSYDNQPMTADNTAIVHRATWDIQFPDVPLTGAWKPSIHMPRWASRIDLEIVSIRVERLQDISEADAKAEGAPLELGELERLILGAKAKYRSGFVRLWESIHGAGSWDANPWVWVVEFRREAPQAADQNSQKASTASASAGRMASIG